LQPLGIMLSPIDFFMAASLVDTRPVRSPYSRLLPLEHSLFQRTTEDGRKISPELGERCIRGQHFDHRPLLRLGPHRRPKFRRHPNVNSDVAALEVHQIDGQAEVFLVHKSAGGPPQAREIPGWRWQTLEAC